MGVRTKGSTYSEPICIISLLKISFQQGLTQTYQKFLVIPKPDYGQRCTLWKEMITANGGLIAKYSDRFNLSGLSKVSDGYTAGSIRNAVELVMSTCAIESIVSNVDFDTTPQFHYRL